MRILVATDAWRPQLNGVVRTYERLRTEVEALGVEMVFLTPNEFRTFPCPTYPEIRLAYPRYGYVIDRLDLMRPDAIHIATEGPIGWMTRAYCQRTRMPFTTAFHTRFPDYVAQRFGVPLAMTWAIERRFHNAGAGVMVATQSLGSELARRGFRRVMPWTRGVDTAMFRPRPVRRFGSDTVFLYVGRVAVEKNIEAFLLLDLPGRKVVVGDGPLLDSLRRRYPTVLFTGRQEGEDLAECYASADVFVFPSRTDTFGIVLLEALASGLPVAAYPVSGPIDNIQPGVTGVLDEDLARACLGALKLPRSAVCRAAETLGWDASARLFVRNIDEAILSPSGRRLHGRQVRLPRTRIAG